MDRPPYVGSVVRRNGTIFIPLPPELHKDRGPCCCPWCIEHAQIAPECCGKFDTLAISESATVKGADDYPWFVHFPQISQHV